MLEEFRKTAKNMITTNLSVKEFEKYSIEFDIMKSACVNLNIQLEDCIKSSKTLEMNIQQAIEKLNEASIECKDSISIISEQETLLKERMRQLFERNSVKSTVAIIRSQNRRREEQSIQVEKEIEVKNLQ